MTKLGIVHRDNWPEWLKHPAVKGIHVNGCVVRGVGSRFRAKAHAHCETDDEYRGWICFLSERRLTIKELGLHELAHLITPGGHTDAWRNTVITLGGTLDEVVIFGEGVILKSYQKKSRSPIT